MFIRKLFPQFMLDADTGSTGGSGDTDTKDTDKDGQSAGGADNTKGTDTKVEALSKEDIMKLIQSETDKVRTEYSKKLKDKDKELEETKKSKMSDAEKAEYELNQLKENLSQKEKDLLTKEMTLTTIELLKENDLPLEVKDFLMGKDEESTVSNIKVFKDMFSKAVEQAVEGRFKSSGKDHKTGDTTSVRYTHDMLKTMSATEINANWDQIQKDLSK